MIKKCATNILVCCLLLMVPVITQSQATRTARFDPDGSFWIKGQAPADFSDFGDINLNRKHSRHMAKSGVGLTNGKLLPYKLLSVKQERFTFTTTVIGGVSYSFVGKFLRGGVFQSTQLDDETPVLEGVLTRYKAGRKVATAKLSFVYFGGT
jgi:hypothetical protein